MSSWIKVLGGNFFSRINCIFSIWYKIWHMFASIWPEEEGELSLFFLNSFRVYCSHCDQKHSGGVGGGVGGRAFFNTCNDITLMTNFRLLQIRMRYQLTTLGIPLYSVMLTVMELKSSSWACRGLVTIVVLSEYISVRLKSVLHSCTKNWTSLRAVLHR